MTLEISRQIFEKSSNIKLQANPSSCSMRTERRTGGQRDRHYECSSSFCNFAKAPNVSLISAL